MLHTKSQSQWPFGSREEEIKRVFTIYGRGGHVSHVTITIWFKFTPLKLKSPHIKFEFNWPSGF